MVREGGIDYNSAMNLDLDKIINRKGTNSLKWSVPKDDDVLPLWVADMDFPAPECVRKALADRVNHGIFGYTLPPESLYQSFLDWRLRRDNWKIQRDHVLLTGSVLDSVRIALEAFTSPGDGVAVQLPVYYPLYQMPGKLGRKLVINPLIPSVDHYTMDFADLDSKLQGGVKMLILCNPHNPVGRVWTKDELDELLSICRKHNVLILSDDIHADLIMSGHHYSPLSACELSADLPVIICHSPNKTFNIAGIPAGFTVIPDPDTRDRFLKERDKAGMNLPNLLSITAAEAAYGSGEQWLDRVLKYIYENYLFVNEYLTKELPDAAVYPLEGTYLVWIDFSAYREGSGTVNKRLLKEGKIFLSDGASFGKGGDGFQRLNAACPRRLLEEGLVRIRKVLKKT